MGRRAHCPEIAAYRAVEATMTGYLAQCLRLRLPV